MALKDRDGPVGQFHDLFHIRGDQQNRHAFFTKMMDELSGMYIGRSALFAPDNVDGSVRFRSEKPLKPGDFVTVRYTRTAGRNLIGESVSND